MTRLFTSDPFLIQKGQQMSEMAIAREKKRSQLSIVQRKQIERRHGLDNPSSAGHSHSLRLSLTARPSAEIQYQYLLFD